MKDSAMEPTTTSATRDAVTTVSGKRKHAFFVTPEGAAPATTPRYAPLAESRHVGDELEVARRRVLRIGVALFVVGLAVTIGTFAISSATGGSGFLVATGPMIAGIVFMLRGSR